MTDWMPWGFVVATGLFVTTGTLLTALASVPSIDRNLLRRARRAFWATVVLGYALFAMYVLFQERWLWY